MKLPETGASGSGRKKDQKERSPMEAKIQNERVSNCPRAAPVIPELFSLYLEEF